MSPKTRVALWSFWEYMAFVINSMVFLLIGIEVHIVQMLASWEMIFVAAGAALLGRVLVVYGLTPASNRLKEPIPRSWQHVLVWGGLHGSISIALALSLPQTFPHRSLLLTMTFGVVAFSLVVQGLTMKPLLGWLRLSGEVSSEYERLKARQLANAAARKELDSLHASSQISHNVHARLAGELEEEAKQLRGELEALHQQSPGLAEREARLALLHMIKAERSAIQRGLIEGIVPPGAGEQLLEEADGRIDRLTKKTPHDGA